MRPLNNYVTIELIDEPSPIIQLDKRASPKGTVTGIGTKVKADLKIGDIVYYYAKTGHEYKGNHFVKEEEILGKV